MTDTIKNRLARNELILAIGVGRVVHHNMLQMLGLHGGFHAVWFDVEHTGLTVPDLEIGVMAARSGGMDSFIRIPPTDYALVTRCLETGAAGVMAAQIFSADQAEEFVSWCKFFPRGRRGLNAGGYDGRFGTVPIAEFCEQANRDSFVAIQIETAQSVEECDAIAAIDGVDLLFIGPSDLSQGLGVTGEFFHPKCLEAIDCVAAACRNHGKQWGAVCANPEHAKLMIEKGCKMLSPASDVKLINAGIAAVKAEYQNYFN